MMEAIKRFIRNKLIMTPMCDLKDHGVSNIEGLSHDMKFDLNYEGSQYRVRIRGYGMDKDIYVN